MQILSTPASIQWLIQEDTFVEWLQFFLFFSSGIFLFFYLYIMHLNQEIKIRSLRFLSSQQSVVTGQWSVRSAGLGREADTVPHSLALTQGEVGGGFHNYDFPVGKHILPVRTLHFRGQCFREGAEFIICFSCIGRSTLSLCGKHCLPDLKWICTMAKPGWESYRLTCRE